MSKVDILKNKAGVPLIAYGKSFIAVTKGAPAEKKEAEQSTKKVSKISVSMPKDDDPFKTSVVNIEIVDWGTGNKFPDDALTTIESVGVLNTGLRFVRNFTLGQGIFPANIKGYDKYGNELLELVNDPDIVKVCNGRVVRRYMEKAGRDYFKFAPAFVEIIMNGDGTKVAGINAVNARYCRLSKANNKGEIEWCVISGKWPDTPSENECEIVPVLSEYDPVEHLKRLQLQGKAAGKKFMYVVMDSWSNNDYYGRPLWYSAHLAGWTYVAAEVPVFLRKAYRNQITWKWHVQIPYSFFDKKFPDSDFEDKAAKDEAIDAFMDSIENNLCGAENADKPIFTFYTLNEISGKAEEQWIIKPLENKYTDSDKLITSAAANSEIMFALMINPNVMGAGMPGGTYAGNQGGSNIREAYLVNIANAWLDRQNLLDPIELMLEYNGVGDVQIRYRNTLLVTLDSGKGTVNNLS